MSIVCRDCPKRKSGCHVTCVEYAVERIVRLDPKSRGERDANIYEAELSERIKRKCERR